MRMVVDGLDGDAALRLGGDEPVGSVLVSLARVVSFSDGFFDLETGQPSLIESLKRVVGPDEALDRLAAPYFQPAT